MEMAQESFQRLVDPTQTFSMALNNIFEHSHSQTVEMVEQFIIEIDNLIYHSSYRKKHWVVQRKEDVRTIFTLWGPIRLCRRYYRSKKTGAYKYLLDEHLGIEKYERIDSALKAKLVEEATQLSYSKVISRYEYTGLQSKMTVCNVIKSIQLSDNQIDEFELRGCHQKKTS